VPVLAISWPVAWTLDMPLFGRWDRDVRRAMEGRPNFRVSFSRNTLAMCLWDFGEDALVERAFGMSDDDLAAVQRIAAVYEDGEYPLPREGRIAHMHVSAFAAIAYFEGSLRPLARDRRRPEKDRPAHLRPHPPDPLVEA
jgi:hypothetical protein